MWVSPSGRQALVACVRNSSAGHLLGSVLLLGSDGSTRLRQLEPFAHNDVIAFGS
jgi:hypothetical protein